MRWDLTPGNVHDLAPVKGGMLRGIKGICFAHSGRVSGQIRQDLTPGFGPDRQAERGDQGDCWVFDRVWAKSYRQRQVVEDVFYKLKNRLGF